ncbi:hypothetical protein ACWC9T_13675 [Kitasatospora sp. NPDC001159]
MHGDASWAALTVPLLPFGAGMGLAFTRADVRRSRPGSPGPCTSWGVVLAVLSAAGAVLTHRALREAAHR